MPYVSFKTKSLNVHITILTRNVEIISDADLNSFCYKMSSSQNNAHSSLVVSWPAVSLKFYCDGGPVFIQSDALFHLLDDHHGNRTRFVFVYLCESAYLWGKVSHIMPKNKDMYSSQQRKVKLRLRIAGVLWSIFVFSYFYVHVYSLFAIEGVEKLLKHQQRAESYLKKQVNYSSELDNPTNLKIELLLLMTLSTFNSLRDICLAFSMNKKSNVELPLLHLIAPNCFLFSLRRQNRNTVVM